MYFIGFVVYYALCSWSAGDPVPLDSSPVFSGATDVPISLFSSEEKAFDHGSTDTLSTINPEHTTSETLVSADFKSDKELASTQPSVVIGIADIIRFQQLVRTSCKWQDTSGLERQPRICSNGSCDLGPVTITRISGSIQLYFCEDDQNLLVNLACRLEDSERVVVLPRCVAGSRCSIGPLNLSYEGKPLQGYFCDSQILPITTRWSDETESSVTQHKPLDRNGFLWHSRGRAQRDDVDDYGNKDIDWNKDKSEENKVYDKENHEVDPINRGQVTENESLGYSEMTSRRPDLNRKRIPGTTP